MNYEIKITGGGTAKEIADALKQIAENIQVAIDNNQEEIIDGASWEDPTLMTEINAE